MTRAIICLSETPGMWLARAEELHRNFRPELPTPYADYMGRMFGEGAEMALLVEQEQVLALAVFRCHHTTFHGYRFYVDDLVTRENRRGEGHGTALLEWLEGCARARGCRRFDLESGLQRPDTHRFYFRRRMAIFAFGFTKTLTDGSASEMAGR